MTSNEDTTVVDDYREQLYFFLLSFLILYILLHENDETH